MESATKMKQCENISADTASSSMQMCACPIVPQIQKQDPDTSTWYCQ
jgi:hypothetical protein